MFLKVLGRIDHSKMNEILLDEHGYLKVVDANILKGISHIERQAWARENGVYHFITTEMIAWLREIIGERSAIEICAGKGAIGRSLSIISTDSYVTEQPEILYRYESEGEVSTNPPGDVLKFDSLKAVRFFKPKVVVGAFVSQLYKQGENYNLIHSSPFGTDEEEILKLVDTYIVFGNKETHKGKRIFKKKHKEYSFPWLINRAVDQDKNRVWVWNRY